MFGVGLRAACFHSDMTKHTVSPSSSSLLSPPTNCLPHSSPRLSICPCLSVCEHRAKTLRPRKPPPTFTTCLLPSPCPRPPPHPTSPLLKKKKIQSFCVLGKRDFSPISWFKSVEIWNKALYLNLRNSSKKKRKWNKWRRISLFSAWSRVCFCVEFCQKMEINAVTNSYLWRQCQVICFLP